MTMHDYTVFIGDRAEFLHSAGRGGVEHGFCILAPPNAARDTVLMFFVADSAVNAEFDWDKSKLTLSIHNTTTGEVVYDLREEAAKAADARSALGLDN